MASKFEKFSDPGRDNTAVDHPKVKPEVSRFSPIVLSRVSGMVIAGLLSVILIHFVHKYQVVEKEQAQLQQLATQRAQLTAKNIESYLGKVRATISRFSDKSLLLSALEKDDKDALDNYAQELRRQLQDTAIVRFFTLKSAERDVSAFPPIRFAELELIRFSEERKPTRPEAVQANNQWLISFVQPVPNNSAQAVAGTIFVSLKADALNAVLELNNIGLGQVSLVQQFANGRPLVVAQYDSDVVADVYRASVADTPWFIDFSPSQRLQQQTEISVQFIFSILVVVCVLLFVLALWLGKVIGERIEEAKRLGKKGAWQTIAAVAYTQDEDDELAGALHRKTDILDVDIADEDEKLLGLQKEEQRTKKSSRKGKEAEKETPVEGQTSIPDVVFRAYDIRGHYGTEITEDLAMFLGQALGSEALDIGEDTLIVARDARTHSPKLTEYLVRGILSSGCHVLNIGTVPTPLMYFATETLEESSSGVMVTASHNAAAQNGFKIVMKRKSRAEEDIKAIRTRILDNNFYSGQGEESRKDIVPSYIDAIFSDVALAGTLSIVVDAGNAVAGLIAPRLFEELGCNVTPLYCDLDGSFPNHEPDTSVAKNLQDLIVRVKEVGADLGVAFDGDGDRLAVVSPSGKIIWPDRLLMLFARDILSRNPGADVVFDVKSTRHLNNCIAEFGGRPIMWKTGHSPMKAKMIESGALVGGEYSGHIFIKDRWFGFDDGLYAAARLIEIISLAGQNLDDIIAEFPETPSTPEIRVPVPESKKFEIVQQLVERGEFGSGKMTVLDGVRVDYSNGWGLIRASNTAAHLTMRFEADDENALHQLKSLFVQQLRAIDSTINVDWNT